jgi:hypothetical protein
MRTAIRTCLFCVIVLTTGTIVGQDKTEPPKIKGTLPANWGKIGLSDDQKQQIYKLQADYSEKIIALEKQLKEMRAKEKQALEAVLNDEQKKLLKEIILKKAGSDDKK